MTELKIKSNEEIAVLRKTCLIKDWSMAPQLIESHRCFGGYQNIYTHWSDSNQCEMRFAVYLPPQAEKEAVPALYWLSGLTCSEQNFITKASAQRVAAELGLAIIVSDTSPRGVSLQGVDQQNGVGEGAGFYLDATEAPWCDHYQMYTYVSHELWECISKYFPINPSKCGLFGHSMGGHGALTIGLRNPQQYRSLSAFAPICSLTNSPWGQHALQTYLGPDQSTWKHYDACHLLQTQPWPHGKILIDQGVDDPFLERELKPTLLMDASAKANIAVQLQMRETYDHSYYFIASFIEEHLRFHAEYLKKK